MTDHPTAIEVAGMRKSYGDNAVLRGIDLTVPAGTVYALLGPNGAGKTTMIRILSTLIAADAGEARVAGFDVRREPDAVRRSIGVTGQFSAIDELLTGRENLRLMADLVHLPRRRGRARAQQLLERFDLVDAADRGAATYSGGMRRRLDLAMTLVGAPRLIFLDEPTTGLDPRSRRELWQVVRELVDDGVTILLTTQYLEEADELAHRVGVLDGGHLVAEGTPAELKRRVPGGRVEVRYADPLALAAEAGVAAGATADEESLTLSIPHDGSLEALRRVTGRLDDKAVTGLEVHSPDLDDVFLALTGHRTRAAQEAPAMSTRTNTPRIPSVPGGADAGSGPDVLRDSWTMLRRNLLQMVRYRSLTLMLLAQPLIFLLLFVFVFGATMGAGLPGGDDRADYLSYIMPAIVVITVASVSLNTAYTIALDMEKGIVDRFRTMAIAKSSVLTGRVLGAIILTAVAFAVVMAVAFGLGYRSDATVLGWLGVVGLVLLMTLALTWFTVALGLSAPNAETASSTPMPLMFLPFLSSGFVPTDSMPAGIRWFAEHQPFTPMINTLRAWLSGAGAGPDAWLAVGWCLVIAVLCYLWARRLYTKVRAS